MVSPSFAFIILATAKTLAGALPLSNHNIHSPPMDLNVQKQHSQHSMTRTSSKRVTFDTKLMESGSAKAYCRADGQEGSDAFNKCMEDLGYRLHPQLPKEQQWRYEPGK